MNSLYFNHAFARPPLPEVIAAMRPHLQDSFENPLTDSSGGEASRQIVAHAREAVAALLNASPAEIYFTSSGTESNNWAIKGIAASARGNAPHLVISAVEHFSVLQSVQYLGRRGAALTIVPVDAEGRVDPEAVARAIRPETCVVSVIAASDEVGTIQDLSAIADLKKRYPDVLFHTDAVQYLCYEALDTKQLLFDLVSLSSNALYGPAGVAALFVREGTRLTPLLHGGMQEEGLRPGLQSLALLAGFGEAARINVAEKARWKTDLLSWRNSMFAFFERLKIPVTGSRTFRLADNLHGIVDVDGEALLSLLGEDGIRASTGSTCSAYAQKESHVLKAMGITAEQARGAILLTAGIEAHRSIEQLQASFKESLLSLRALKPW